MEAQDTLNNGMSRRDQFAMAALTGLVSSDSTGFDILGLTAYEIADQMLAASDAPAPSGKLEEADALPLNWYCKIEQADYSLLDDIGASRPKHGVAHCYLHSHSRLGYVIYKTPQLAVFVEITTDQLKRRIAKQP